jgi:fructose-1,6-bisphosphatase/inositol monophosphatase family enzyme
MEAVSDLIRGAARIEIIPRFRKLTGDDVIAKPSDQDPDDIVTAADRAAELWLKPRLEKVVPGALVVGEEAAAKNPDLVGVLDSDAAVFLVDPVDGTKNFAAGTEDFGVMVALVRRSRAEAAWIYLPARDELFAARAGAGVFVNGAPLVRQPPAQMQAPPVGRTARPASSAWRGTLNVRYVPQAVRELVPSWYAAIHEHVPPVGCGAVEYTEIARGSKDFTLFYRLLPWDHVPGALIVHEAGGAVRHLDGTNYGARSRDQLTVAVRDSTLWCPLVRDVFGVDCD